MKEFGNSVIRKGIPKNENLDIILDIVEKIHRFNKQKNLTSNQPVFYTPKRPIELNILSKKEIYPFNLNENFCNEIRNDEENIDKMDLKKSDKYINLSNLSVYYILKNIVNSHTKTINLNVWTKVK